MSFSSARGPSASDGDACELCAEYVNPRAAFDTSASNRSGEAPQGTEKMQTRAARRATGRDARTGRGARGPRERQ
ncbi:conserved hypothetical protein [Burkholderia pseudomallei MSHR346]|nr:conserved hypothetical protein [Burkholderia pseudomallei MSHR346]